MNVYRTVEDALFAGKKYNVIYIDPPWKYMPDIGDRRRTINGVRVKQARSRCSNSSPDAQYETMPPAEIARLPIGDLADRNCWLFMWVVNSLTPEALECARRWGFRFSTWAFMWEKVSKATGRPVPGQGWTTLSGMELCMVAKRGTLRRASMRVHQVLRAPRGGHSAKPAEVRARIEALMGPATSKVEVFQRGPAPEGWDVVGRQAGVPDQRLKPFIAQDVGGGGK